MLGLSSQKGPAVPDPETEFTGKEVPNEEETREEEEEVRQKTRTAGWIGHWAGQRGTKPG
jgi:hypothetical protein